MPNLNQTIDRSLSISRGVATVLERRVREAYSDYATRIRRAQAAYAASAAPASAAAPQQALRDWWQYNVDFVQRSILFWDTLRQRGNNWIAHEAAGKPPVLAYKYEMLCDGRTFERRVNHALVRIVPPAGVDVDDKLRPYIIIDPRAGHGPGIGGFKEDSEVGVALKAGHPVYFVIFFPDPEPGQTLADVTDAEAEFVRIVAERHPDSAKPVLVGNCQGGWAVMMLAAARPEIAGPLVINGAPMSYWAGNDGDNPMRYAGGLLGGTWLSLFASDLGGGKFDGAHLVESFENLNPANTLWEKYHHLFDAVDDEAERFLDFERWWGGFYLMNEEEIRWIVNNLFIGNKLAQGEARLGPGRYFDLKAIKQPIIVFASMGDNITPPQQAFNWISDLYSSTEEIKANGQTIVGLIHKDVGHLGIFVSGTVAKKEHTQIVSVLKYIQALPPGLYGMEIDERIGADGDVEYDVTLRERKLEDLKRLQKFDPVDEKPI
jgi:pimeloyl-ACP methyl ester carboxylesterase